MCDEMTVGKAMIINCEQNRKLFGLSHDDVNNIHCATECIIYNECRVGGGIK